jgi:NADH:ubiquinone oxidoreductase subunit 6 (subunit J)
VVALGASFSLKVPSAVVRASSEAPVEGFGGSREMGLVLYSEYAVPLEATALVLLAAIVAAVVLSKRKLSG